MVSLSGSGASAFTITQPTVNGGGTVATFTITYTPAAGISTATVVINNASATTQGSPDVPFTIEGEALPADDGSVETATTSSVTGFAFNPLNLSESVNVEIELTGQSTQTLVANDVNATTQTLVGSPDHGFSYAPPALSAGTYTLTVLASDPGTGSTTVIGTSTLVFAGAAAAAQNTFAATPAVSATPASIISPIAPLTSSSQSTESLATPDFVSPFLTASNPDVFSSTAASPFSSGSDQSLLDAQNNDLLL
jgi:hypothetical protein